MTDADAPKAQLLLYQTEDVRRRVECRYEGETLWLTQALMADLFQITPQNITLHLRELYAEGELVEGATCKPFLQVRTEGGRQVRYREQEDASPRAIDAAFERAVKQLPKAPPRRKTKRGGP